MNGLSPYPPATTYDHRRFEVLFKWWYCMGDRHWPGETPLGQHLGGFDTLKDLACNLRWLSMGWERRN